MSAGNDIMVAAFLSDSGSEILPLLDHFRVPYRLVDEDRLPEPDAVSALLVAGPGTAKRLSNRIVPWLAKHLSGGGGTLWIDPFLGMASPELAALLGLACAGEPQNAVQVVRSGGHGFLFGLQSEREALSLHEPVSVWGLAVVGHKLTLLEDEEGRSIWQVCAIDSGRIGVGTVDPALWRRSVLGPAAGLDDLLWRSLAWVARKPFVMMPLPPFVCARVDDVTGGKGFEYVEILNRRQLSPNLGLDIDFVSPPAQEGLRNLAECNAATFSPHAFTSYRFVPTEQTQLIYMDFENGDYPDHVLAENLRRVDAFFGRLGLTQAKALNYHYCQIGSNCGPALRERGVRYLTFPFLPGEVLETRPHRDWRPKPYGRYGYVLDRLPDGSFLVICAFPFQEPASAALQAGQFMVDVRMTSDLDFLYGCNLREPVFRDHDRAAAKLIFQLRRGLSSLFFGHVFTHEPYLIKLTAEDLEEILRIVFDRWLAGTGCSTLAATLDQIGDYVSQWLECRLVRASYDTIGRELALDFESVCSPGLRCVVFTQGRADVTPQWLSVDLPAGETRFRTRL